MTNTTVFSDLLFPPVRRKGPARGALICGIFGTVWMLEALFFGHAVNPASLVLVTALAITLIAWPLAIVYSRTGEQSCGLFQSVARSFWSIVAIEWTACILAANWLSHEHRYELIPQAIGLIVGLHFLPLGKIFRMPIYYATGSAMVLGSLLVSLVPGGPVHSLVAYGLMGLCLWGTTTVILATPTRG